MRLIGGNGLPKKEIQGVASGALLPGSPAALNSDGTVSAVAEFTVTQGVGTPVNFTSGNSKGAYDPVAEKVVFVYRDSANSGYGTAVVATVTTTSISFGTPAVFESADSRFSVACYDEQSGKIVVAYSDHGNSQYTTAVVGTVSGTSISFGTPTVVSSAETGSQYISAVYDNTNGKTVLTWAGSSPLYGRAAVGTVSGTSISFGSVGNTYQGSSYTGFYSKSTFDRASGKVVNVFVDLNNSTRLTAVVGTVVGTGITFDYGGAALIETTTSRPAPVYDPSTQKVVVFYRNSSGNGRVRVCTVSGTSISAAAAVTFETGTSTDVYDAAYNAAAEKVMCYYRDGTNSGYPTIAEGQVSGTSITLSSPFVIQNVNASDAALVYDAHVSKSVVQYTASDYVVYTSGYTGTTLTESNFAGFSLAGYADGQNCSVLTKGSVDDNQSSLTAGQGYYVNRDGTLSTTPGDPSVFVGTAISANKLIVMG